MGETAAIMSTETLQCISNGNTYRQAQTGNQSDHICRRCAAGKKNLQFPADGRKNTEMLKEAVIILQTLKFTVWSGVKIQANKEVFLHFKTD